MAPATIGAVTRILTNRERRSGRKEEKNFFFFSHFALRIFERRRTLPRVVLMGRSAASKLRRKTQREAAELREQSDATLAMEEEELAREEEDEIVFKRQRTVPDTPRASRDNTPDPDDGEEDRRQFATVLQLVKSVRDQIKALVLDNTNIRAACDDLRRQCHSQGVAFGDLSRLVNRTREDQEETRAYSRGQAGPHPHIRQELLDAEGNLRAQDIGISWQDGETFLHGVRIMGQRDAREEDLRRPATAEPYPSCQRDREDACRHRTNRVANNRQGA